MQKSRKNANEKRKATIAIEVRLGVEGREEEGNRGNGAGRIFGRGTGTREKDPRNRHLDLNRGGKG